MSNNALIEKLNAALGWEMRATTMYAHYAAYVGGIHRLHLKPYFEAESTESVGHGNLVRGAIGSRVDRVGRPRQPRARRHREAWRHRRHLA